MKAVENYAALWWFLGLAAFCVVATMCCIGPDAERNLKVLTILIYSVAFALVIALYAAWLA